MEVVPVAVWLAAYLALLLAGAPVAAALCPRVSDRGAGAALPLAVAVVGVVAYWVGHLAFGPVALAAGLLALLGLVAAATRRDVRLDRRALAETAAAFTLAFLLFVAIRAVDPSVHPGGGEKFLDFGLLKSLLRAPRLPPEDVWFAGEPVQYYYGGHLLAALLARLTLTPARYAYNLALAGFYAMLVAAAYGLAGAVGADHGTPRPLAGGLGAFFAGVASNLLTSGRVVLWLLPDGVARALARPLGLGAEDLAWSPAGFFYWDASRVIPGTINEFPFFAWLNGDLHAHMMSTPFLLLAATLLYSYYRTPAEQVWRRRGLVFGALPPVAGLLAVVNTWSFPSVGGLVWLTVAFAPAPAATLLPAPVARRLNRRDRGGRPWIRRELARHAAALAVAAGVLLAGAVASLPFWLGSASGREVALFPERSTMAGLLLVHGGFLLAFVPYLAGRAWPAVRERAGTGSLAAALVLAAPAAWLGGFAAVALFGPVLVAAWTLLRWHSVGADRGERRGVPDVGFETLLLLAGTGLVLLVEFAYVKEQAGPERFNTVFKTYMQVWVLWAPAAGVALARLVEEGPPLPSVHAGRWRTGASLLVATLVVATSLYAGFALANHFDTGGRVAGQEGPTLDALAFVDAFHSEEAEAIRWLDAREGQPNIVTVPGCWCSPVEDTRPYRWVSAPSSLTGVPTLAGWSHEVGYRNREAYRTRVDHVETIYTGPPERQAELLRAYDVEYVYVGPLERRRYDDIDLSGLDGIEVAHRSGDVVVYRVNRDELAT